MATCTVTGKSSWTAEMTYSTSFNTSTGQSTLTVTAFRLHKASNTTVASTTTNTKFYIIINGTSYLLGTYTMTVPKGGAGSTSQSCNVSITTSPGAAVTLGFDDPWNNLWLYNKATATVYAAGKTNYSVVVRIANMDCYGNYGTPGVWINTTVAGGTSVDYGSYGDASGPDNNTNNVVHYSNSSVKANVDTTVYSSRRTYGFDLNIYDPTGAQSGDTGAAGYVDYSVDNGTTGTKVCNEPVSSHYIDRPIKIKNISPRTGMKLSKVTKKLTASGAETTLTASSGVYGYNQPAETAHLNVYMAWQTYAISYNANGGTGAPSAQTKTYGTNLTLSSTKPTKSNTTATGYTVTFNGNGGTASKASQAATNTTTYTFNNWKDGAGTTYAAGGTYTKNQADTLTAQWNSSTTKGAVTTATATKSNGTSIRTVTYNANGGTCSTTSQNSTATITYACNGWYTAASGGTKRCASGGSYTPSASETVYAQYTGTTGTFSAITLPTPTRAGYVFKGWSTSSTATSGTTGSYTPTGNVTLYATGESAQANMNIKVSGVWKKGPAFVKVSGAGKSITKVYVKVNGAGKETN